MNDSLQLRRKILDISFKAKSGHLGCNLSTVQLLWVLYSKILAPKQNFHKFILSKGHGALTLYVVLARMGIISEQQLNSFYQNGSVLYTHASHYVPGVEVSTGSLGHGAGIGLGMALAKRLEGNKGKIYILMGDGECNEGSIWQMAMLASALHLSNIVTIIDNNNLQALGQLIDNNDLANKWKAFGWNVVEINGHDLNQIEQAYNLSTDRPLCIIAHTIKGCGISDMENNNNWHYSTMDRVTYEKFKLELSV